MFSLICISLKIDVKEYNSGSQSMGSVWRNVERMVNTGAAEQEEKLLLLHGTGMEIN